MITKLDLLEGAVLLAALGALVALGCQRAPTGRDVRAVDELVCGTCPVPACAPSDAGPQ